MNNRAGIDEYGIFLIWAGIIVSLISFAISSKILSTISLLIVFYALFRVLSTNKYQRLMENRNFKEKFLDPIKSELKIKKKNKKDKTYKYIKCPNCKQELRIPKNKGKIKVKCPKCQHKFDARS
ncbi:MJ0042-type zinc finger domain-containing protein [Anaerococcus tetradius]|jgi:hypothetical protein|uniref:MJ0042 family finger-like domain protein n=1 Tax=Anaerococcus tetradius ATCC 35098 TaxID=525255 RepID=C2CKA4_9FIRM|nr:MJ0042-type zinc finger domain-containing protein [Anaerococcus tetradius]EEI82035.1 MJ0042 family finger-like domain protein [Anaerococcus tetradius ATCC 35098]